jgi:ribosomal protein S18 acetylase RimI-like enzyme
MRASISVPIVIRDLEEADLRRLKWSGGPSHMVAMVRELTRVAAGDAAYLVACAPSGFPVGKAGIDYAKIAGAGEIHQVAVHGAVRSCGVGTLLMSAAEERIRDRGCGLAILGVEVSNPRARALYERLGYVAYGEEPAEWDDDQPDGSVARYRTVCTLMRKPV